MESQEEVLPLNGEQPKNGHHRRGQRIALGFTSALLLVMAVACLPPAVSLWHPFYYPSLEIEQRAWTWLGANSIWLALALLWTLFHVDNGPCMATACVLSSIYWAYMNVVMIVQWARGQLSLVAIGDFVVHAALLVVCAWAAWTGVSTPSSPHSSRSDGSATWKRVFRKWALVFSSAQLFVAFASCTWPYAFPLTPPVSERESPPWEWNSAVLLTMALLVLWAAFLTRGGLVDETKRAACAWCALVFAGGLVLSSVSWSALGLTGRSSQATSVLLAVDVCVFLFAALV